MSDNTVKVDILQIDTSQSQQSVAGLKKEIRELKDRLVGLDQGTQEYNKTLLELGNKTHKLKEINEQVRRTTSDFGDTLSNVRGTIGGLSGAFQTVLGSLSLMGVEMGDDVKMLKMLQSAMAITQGVAAIDAGVKSFKALTISIKAATTAAGGMKKALVATGIGALVAGIGLLIDKLGIFDDEAEDTFDDLKEMAKDYKESLAGTSEEMNRMARVMKLMGSTDAEIEKARLEKMKSAYDEMVATEDRIIQQIRSTDDAATRSRLTGWLDNVHQQLMVLKNDMDNFSIDSIINEMERIVQQVDADVQKYNQAMKELVRQKFQNMKDASAAFELYNEITKKMSGDRELELYQLQQSYEDKKTLLSRFGFDLKKIEEAYQKERQAIINKYRLEEIERYEADEKEKSEQAVQSAQTSIKAMEDEYTMLEIARNAMLADIAARDKGSGEINPFSLEDYYKEERVSDAEAMMEQAYLQLLDKKIELNQQLLENDNLTLEARQEVEDQILQLEAERAEKSVEIEQKALERRKKLYQNFSKGLGSIVGSINDILGTIGSTLEQGSQEWKNVMIAEAVISTIKGGIDAYMGMIQSIPGPWGIAAGAAAAAATVAAGIAEVAKIRNTKISTTDSSSTSGSTALGTANQSAVSMLSSQVTNTRNIATEEDVANLPDTRVYVLENDITTAQKNVRVTVENATY